MHATVCNYLRGMSKPEYQFLKDECKTANNLYNSALYQLRQHYFATGKRLSYEKNYEVLRSNENYPMLPAKASQQVLKAASEAMKSFMALKRKAKKGEYDPDKVRLPAYRPKGGLMSFSIPAQGLMIHKGYLLFPLSHYWRREGIKEKLGEDFKIPFPDIIDPKTLEEVQVIPIQGGKAFKITYTYEVLPTDLGLDPKNIMGIDLGVNNLATCVTTDGTSFILDGRYAKSINHQYNKDLARLRSISMRQHRFEFSKQEWHVVQKRNDRIEDVMKKSARYIVDYCVDHNIGSIVVGRNVGWKQMVNIGHVQNQNFTQISHAKLRSQLRFLCEKYGIFYSEQEESYTSKSSFLDGDPLPVYTEDKNYTGIFSGRRIHRGLYCTADGLYINADSNGAANIIRKWFPDLSEDTNRYQGLCEAVRRSPERIRLVTAKTKPPRPADNKYTSSK